jgi:coenzyme F420-0:L-glutamate ligase/coenzyme F420-1:gamma-L-glutamate ligase
MHVEPVGGLPEVTPDDDVGELIDANVDLQPDDVLCVASTIVSKAEGRQANFAEYEATPRTEQVAAGLEETLGKPVDPRFVAAIFEESEEILLTNPFILTVLPFGHTTVNAGVDRSNIPDADMILLPTDPAASARRIAETVGCAVVVTDTSGRPFRLGQRNVALGWAGIDANRDWRGETDREGRELTATVQCVVDELAGAANLVTGEGDGGTPAAVIRDWDFGDHDGDDQLFRPADEDVIRDALRDWDSGV